MKVFLITRGEYSDYGVCAVSLDREDAERKCALLNRDAMCDEYCEIEEYDTDDMVVDTGEEVKKRFEMSVSSITGDIEYFIESYLTFDDENKVCYNKRDCLYCEEYRSVHAIATFPTDTTEEQAKKIMLDRVAKFKAERAGL